jgi:glucosamine--fructose-6-phosphate aminotransferase (isomerizing)
MCAIFGLAFQNGHHIRNTIMIKNIVRRLFLESRIRGRDASGVSYVSPRGINVLKKDISAENFINLPEYDEQEDWGINEDTEFIIGHCRARTQGTERNNVNNHPIVRDRVIGVHNGVIRNDHELFYTHTNNFCRNGEVDSEIIFALIEHLSKSDSVTNAISKASGRLKGSFACAMVHTQVPHVVWLFRNTSPCDIICYPKVGLIIWSSVGAYINKATKYYRDELGKGVFMPIESGMCVAINVKENKFNKSVI